MPVRVVSLNDSAIPEMSPSRRMVSDRVMSKKDYDANKRLILKTLRGKGDPPPRIMAHGSGCLRTLFLTVEARLKQVPGARLVRGYKMYTVPLVGHTDWTEDAIKATFHMVLARPSRDDSETEVYECACAADDPYDQDKPFVFVPSSRAHPQVSDSELLANYWIPGCVVFGNLPWADITCAVQRVVGRSASVIGTTPEACVTKPNWRVRLHPYFEDWYVDRKPQRHPSDSMQVFAEFFGFPVYPVSDNNNAWKSREYGVMQQGIEGNDVAVVPGQDTLMLCAVTSVRMFSKKMDNEQARACFYKHYDQCLASMLADQEAKLAEIVRANTPEA